ncbi:PAS domain S-box protein [Natronosalvus caseinilyticus]|uniref:PAS domain S-box protein n=1 Tax=Natronosalvus caseinilyticus TaxID=2953747 RepID=UPI0028AB08FD|nr:PAS domain S-box protein [Natronosalvus caseinilyticus]
MGFRDRIGSDVVGRKFIVALGGLFVALVVSYPFLPIVDDASSELWIVLGILVGIPGLVLLYGGYRLPQTDIRSELYPIIGKWCLRGIVVGLAIILPIVLASDDPNIVGNTLLLTALGSLAGFGAGGYDARAKTRQLELQETVDQLETSNARLERHQQYTNDILDAIDDVFYVLDENDSLTRWNQSLSEVSGYTDDEIASMAVADFFEDDDRDTAKAAIRKGFESDSVDVELELRTKDGDTVPFEFVGSTLENTSGDPVLAGIGRDVTDRVEREQELQRVRERMEFALNATDAVVWDWNVEEDQATFYPSAESLYGTPVETWEDFIEVIHPEDRQKTQEAIENTLETGEPKHEEIRIVRDGEVRWIEAPGQPVQDDDGPTWMIGVARDITERKTYERKLEDSNERLEQFAYAASHDLQEPLRMVSSYLRLIENRADEELTEETEEFLEFAVDGADRMRDMIDGLLAYSRVETQGEALEPIDLNEVVEDVRDDLEIRITESDADVDIEELPRVVGDEHQLRQVFQNVLSNAIEYSGDEPPRVHISAIRNGSMWEVSVRDEGIGIEPDEQDRIFEVFQRLQSRNDHGGSGIGLALCERIVERHGGEIRVESEPGEGATFSFTLPAEDEHDE